MNEAFKKELLAHIREIKDYPRKGILFKDITTLLNYPMLFNKLIDTLRKRYMALNIDFIVGIEARGFILGSALAYALGVGFVPIRKKGKLPAHTISQSYSLEYGNDSIEIHSDAFRGVKGVRVVLIDDLLATGGTALASLQLIKLLQAECIEACFLLGLKELSGIQLLEEQVKTFCVLEC
ncbi:adenine phosphoribosyltransferase [Helicobacter cetorum]|uniref:Adenine phosphoribosyltransferase n=1 Tax=Helicobacter cetorum (strain ATCC BAA-540 / CCUG 52418 / MIT 99-5656) TaxID=1163745 RepID=I0EQU3_HELCM|nr:adenine phosphoribosyltransferase [Helicobacter cetorum]AFI05312.1 adenine phosphoribosyltransferase [Helicobacter cetorum MIT 99-5656]